MKFNKTDLNLISELQKDGSISYSDLAKKLGITAKTVAKRVDRLLGSDIIAIRAQPNPFRLGLSASALIAIQTDPAKDDNVGKQLSDNFYINLVQRVFGRFDILAFVYFPNWEMLHQFISDELYAIDGVTQAELYFIKETFKRYERFFVKEPFATSPPKLKEMDWTLIKELAKDGRANPSKLADMLDIHVSTVYRRIEALFKGGFIKISAIPNPYMIAPSSNAYTILETSPDEVDNVCRVLSAFPEVHFIMTTNHRSSIIVCIHTKDTDTLYKFIKKEIHGLNGLSNTETFIRSMVMKTYYGWLIG